MWSCTVMDAQQREPLAGARLGGVMDVEQRGPSQVHGRTRHVVQLFDLRHWERGPACDDLDGFAQPFPDDRGAVDVVPVDDALQRRQEPVQPVTGIEPQDLRDHIGVLTALSHQMMEEQTLLERRQRIHVRDVGRAAVDGHDDLLDLRLRQVDEGSSGVISAASAGMPLGGTMTSAGPPATAARPAGVGVWNNARTDTDTPRRRSNSTIRTASSEWPPSRKKSSSTPTVSRPRTSANAPHTTSSRTLEGARPAPTT